MKIITKPISYKDEIDKSRHLTGFDRWARSSQTLGFLFLFLEWFTIPFEVVFRRDFGQRWLSVVNFFAGGFLITLFLVLQGNWHYVRKFFMAIMVWTWHFAGQSSSALEEAGNSDLLDVIALAALLMIYFLFGGYQLFKIKWRSQVNMSLHSFDDGTSRFHWLAAMLKWILNILATPFMIIFWLFLPTEQRKGKPFPKLIYDRDVFTNVCVEPGIVFFLAVLFTSIASFFLFLSAFALFLHAQRKEMARKSKILDFQDSKIEAEMMKELKDAKTRSTDIVTKAKANMRKQTDVPTAIQVIRHPSLSAIIEEMNLERINLFR